MNWNSFTSGEHTTMAYYDVKFIERFIRQEAARRGIDPDIAGRVARSEGLKENTWQSRVRNKRGQREQSYGPYQLLSPARSWG